MTNNVAASIRARLLNRAKAEGTEFELFLVRYACERFLYRLGESEVRERCILKGASLLALWMEEPYRATRVWALSETFSFDGPELQEAVARCFERRGTDLLAEMLEVLTPAFYSDPHLQGYWMAYRDQGSLLASPPVAFEAVGERIQALLRPLRDSIMAGLVFGMRWPAGGPWRPSAGATNKMEVV